MKAKSVIQKLQYATWCNYVVAGGLGSGGCLCSLKQSWRAP